jgi:hypothetical protein
LPELQANRARAKAKLQKQAPVATVATAVR